MASIRGAVLGMLKLRPMTGYEIKQAYQKGPANFMPMSFGQIYPALTKLSKEKLVRPDKQPGSRGSIRYFITSKGEEALREWLFSPGISKTTGSCCFGYFSPRPPTWPGYLALSNLSEERNKPVSSTMETRVSGWTPRRQGIPAADLEAGPGVWRFAK